MAFQLTVLEEKVKPHQVTGLHMLCAFVIAGTGALFYLLYRNIQWAGTCMMVAGLLLLITAIARNKWILRPANNTIFRVAELVILASAASYLAWHHRWIPTAVPGSMAVAILFALIWERSSDKKLSIQVNNEGIKLPFISRSRNIGWHEVEQVLLRYGILTIDCYNNRLFQYHVEPAGIDQQQFEQYCSDNVSAHADKRPTE